MKKVSRVEYDMSKDPRDRFTKEELAIWCKENFLPEDFFDLSVQKRRDAFVKSQKEMLVIDKISIDNTPKT